MQEKFYAKYRGQVVDNKDPRQLGRIQVLVPDVLLDINTAWAMPATPYAGPGVGFFAIPPIGANVWVEFEGGNHELPIWTGGYWTKQEDMPLSPAGPDTKLFRTEGIFMAHNNSADSVKVGDVDIKKGFTLYVSSPVVDGFLSLFLGVDGLIEINNNGQEIITMNKDKIEVNKESSSIVTLTKTTIDSTTGQTDINMNSDNDTIVIKNKVATVTLNDSNIESTIGTSDLKMTSEKIDASCGGDVQISPSGISLTIGSASIKMSEMSVNVNDGALEVT